MPSEPQRLTPGEYRIMSTLISEHGRVRATAQALGISEQGVKNKMMVVRRKIGVVSNVQLAYRLGAGDLDQWLP